MEEPQAKTEAPAFVYDTLTALSFSDSNPSPPSSQSPATHGDSHFYSVFRNEIADPTVDTTPVESETVDFFSLDVDAGANENGGGFVPPVVASKKSKKRKKGKEAEEPKLETNWFSESSFSKIPMLQLHKEIVDFCDFLLPTHEEKVQRDAAMDNVRSVIQYIWPNCKVEVFGSYRTGLYLPTSDIDVVILESGITNPQLGLRALSRALSQRGIAKNILVIAKARVPIIKFVEKKSSISFDLSFDMENGPKAAEFIQDAVLRLPPLRPLCMILKVFLQQRELNEVYSGGIGSYALLAMLISFLKYLKDGRSPPEHNLGVLLVKFFDFYGRKLNTADVGVSCKRGGSFFSKSNKGFWNAARPGLISIEDPQTPENDIGKSSFNYFQIRSAFAMALSTLTNAKAILALGPNRSILGTIIRPDRTLLERKGGKNGDVTFSSLLPGAGEPLPMQRNDNGLFCNWDLGEEEEEGSFPRTPLVVDTPGSKTRESSRKKKKKSSKKKMVVVLDEEEEEEEEEEEKVTSSKKRRRKNKAKNEKAAKAAAAFNSSGNGEFSWSY
uniref:polynucleotide adenylyltransferase n=1 Tax=Noccaea caerulescens TaxID=107243 RepID=A0A1J3H8V1_NOCCA